MGYGAARTTGQYGEFASRLMQHQEWQREALRESEIRRALQRNGEHPAGNEPQAAGRVSTAIGGTLVRLGTRLQGQPRPTAPSPAH
jgi:hypothetical protein